MKLWGAILKEFDKIFKDYDWVESVESRGLTPILIFCDEKKSYVDLCLGLKEVPWARDAAGRRHKTLSFDGQNVRSREETRHDKHIVFNKILNSRRYQQTAEANDQILFPNFTLSLRGVLNCPRAIPTWDFRWPSRERVGARKIDIAVYGRGCYTIQAQYHGALLRRPVAGFEDIYYEAIAGGRPSDGHDCSVPTRPVRRQGVRHALAHTIACKGVTALCTLL